MGTPAYNLALFVSANGMGTFAGSNENQWSVNVASEPEKPQNCITLYDSGGNGLDTDEQDFLGDEVQVRVRSADYQEGYDKQQAIRELFVQTDAPYAGCIGIAATSGIAYIGRNDLGLYLFTANYRVDHYLRDGS